ncbi:hypothetical protein HS125_03170 [bacterium]|nr:hypothetical protein [bacterium]
MLRLGTGAMVLEGAWGRSCTTRGRLLLQASREVRMPERLTMSVEVQSSLSPPDGAVRRERGAVVFRRDAPRLDVRDRRWLTTEFGERPGRDVRRRWDGEMYWELASDADGTSRLTLAASPEMLHSMLLSRETLGLGLILPGDSRPFFESLLDAPTLGMERYRERVDDGYCYHLSAAGPEYTCELWLDPARGMLPRRIVLARAAAPAGEQPASWTSGATQPPAFQYTLERVAFEPVRDGFLIREARETCSWLFPDGRKASSTTTYRRRNLGIDPDFSGMGAFQINVPEGTIVNGTMVWRGGRLVALGAGEEMQRALQPLTRSLGTATGPAEVRALEPPARPAVEEVPVPLPSTRHAWLEAVALMAACLVVLLGLYVLFQTRRRTPR